ncbi:MAG TPA: copper transporter [Motilibacteraceae bacterium]|nr:copper transporter [Motilibacteraceae bacterium]
MIDFRYHVVSIIAIFMALAVGIVLGSGPLKGPIDNTLQQQLEQLRTDRNDLRTQLAQSKGRLDYDDAVVAQVAPQVLAGRLAERRVALVLLPAADGDLADATATAVRQAGATVTSTVTVTDAWLDPAQQGALGRLVDQSAPTGTTYRDGAGVQERAAAALARALVVPDPALAPAEDASGQAFLEALAAAGFLKVDGSPVGRATLAVVEAGPAPQVPTDGTKAQVTDLVGLATALDAADQGTVVAGPVESAGAGGVVAAVRSGDAAKRLSTVDALGTAAGRMSVPLALAAEAQGTSAAYGFGEGAARPLPSPLPSLTPAAR